MDGCRLSKNDSSVLSALFNPESSLSSTVHIEDSLPRGSCPATILRLQEQERQALHLINGESPETSHVNLAISQLTDIIGQDPSYASAYNNRAQARRMLIRDEDLPRNPEIVADILQDIAKAISLATPEQLSSAISSLDARVLASAHTHRGYLLLLASRSEDNRRMLDDVPVLKDLSGDDLEGAASRELGLGGRYGNETARQLAVKTNPYAKLCGSIVREALTKQIADYYQPSITIAR
ncbi:hypothetical protein LTR10_021053 [Elasticomyces elasticus]|uniref:Uncharacterized protein n=1 Tax=Exophiala sideris TaxID=1016849 RepID=A0ABR0JB87_9EURO|nr:hypothetical protein LTR10_021053 [Elasticomyces elasticus]KAK5027773.1 hypothetical protein LTS07_006648 [Exophiala sideris]KAK5037637.1 hypothetical protein LTR13_004796 [Exophiala sideris]KAK5059299.1 hypothetical protein LTR69_006589 [Exophiala sideris]KAK5183133.1 hypothetical protein LTR44_004844 [Eurotiomycetes sp. CCFEE 6388]